MPSIDKLRHNIRHAVSLSAFSPNLIHRIRYFFLYTVTFRDYSLSKRHDVGSRKTFCSQHHTISISDILHRCNIHQRQLIVGRL